MSPILGRSLRRTSCVALLASMVLPSVATADPKKICFDAYPEAQKLRKAGKLRGAREKLVACSQDSCPAALRKECGQWLGEVTGELPSLLVIATDAKGADTVSVRVTMDGEIVAERLDGKSLETDPGEHAFRFEHEGKTVEQTIVVRQGEKNRKITVDFTPPRGAASASVEPARPPGDAPLEGTPRPVPVTVYVLGGVGIASLAVGAFFFFDQKRLHDDLAGRCAPACSPDDVSPLKTKQVLAGVGLGLGVAALAAATVLFVTRGPAATATASGPRGWRGLDLRSIDVAPTRDGGVIALHGGF